MRAIFSGEAVSAFAQSYPQAMARMTHRLADHPLLSLEAMEDLARAMDPADLEHNAAIDLPMGIANADLPSNALSTVETIRTIERCGSWVLLKKVQQVPAYRALLDEALGEIAAQVAPRTGAMMRPDGYLFISSPRAITPLHFDPDYNILAQIRGSKTMTLFPAEDEEMAPQWFQEHYYGGGPRNLPWRAEFAARGVPHDLHPGDALYVPIHAPHWVKVHEDLSISLSLTWRSVWSHHHADAHRLNRRLRKLGLRPRPPRSYPAGNAAKSVAERALGRVEGALGRR